LLRKQEKTEARRNQIFVVRASQAPKSGRALTIFTIPRLTVMTWPEPSGASKPLLCDI